MKKNNPIRLITAELKKTKAIINLKPQYSSRSGTYLTGAAPERLACSADRVERYNCTLGIILLMLFAMT